MWATRPHLGSIFVKLLHQKTFGCLWLVFDAYQVKGGREHVEQYHNIYIVYTKEAETADAYIERTTKIT